MPTRFPALLLFLSFGICACQLSVPTLAEQKTIINKGGFPGGIPTWVPSSWNDTLTSQPGSRSPSVSVRSRSLSSGIIQLTHGSRQGDRVSLPEHRGPDETVSAQKHSIVEATSGVQGSEEESLSQKPSSFSRDTLSPRSRAERIEEVCPGMGRESIRKVNSNLSPAAEVRELSSLISLCPRSWDLWLLLGKSYGRQNRKEEARQAFAQVLSLDTGNKEAREALRELNK